MLLFVVRIGRGVIDPRPIADALAAAGTRYVQLDATPATVVADSGRVVLATLGHPAAHVAPRRAVARRGEVVACVDGLAVDPRGRFAAWDAGSLLQNWEHADSLEGQFAAVRVDLEQEQVECRTDALGLGPLYVQRLQDGWVVANSVAAIRRLTGVAEPDPLGIASFLTLGWAVGGRTLFEPVRAVRAGCRTTLTAHGASEVEEFTPSRAIAGARATPRGAASTAAFVSDMVSMTRAALVDPGLPVRCAVTAGRDTRAVLALALAAGARPRATTTGGEDHIDVVIGRRVAERAGLDYERWPPEAAGRLDEDPIAAARRFAALTDGLSSLIQLQDIGDLDNAVDRVGVQAWGVGGEIARSGTGPLTAFAATAPIAVRSAALQGRLLRAKSRHLGGVPTAAALQEARGYLDRFAAERIGEGWRPGEVGEAFYTFERVGRWGSTGIRKASPTDDLFSPFASRPFVTYAFSRRPSERYAELPHRRLIGSLRPDLLDIDFEQPWRVRHARLAGVDASGRIVRLAWDRFRPRRRPDGDHQSAGNTPWAFTWLARHRELVRDAVLSTPMQRLWDLADRRAVESAFAEDPLVDWERAEALLRVASVAFALEDAA